MSVSEKEVQELKKELSEMKSLITDYVKETKNAANSAFSPDQMKSLAHELGQNVRGFFDDKKDVIVDQKKSCETKIQENPLASTLIAFVGGAILAALISKK